MADYFGTYQDFEVPNKEDAGVLISADNMVGDVYSVDIKLEDGVHTAFIRNRFDKVIGCFSSDFSRKLSLLSAEGMSIRAILSFVAFTDHPDEGHYWGNMAVICYNPAYEEEFSRFISNVAAKLGESLRPKLDLGPEGVKKVLESDGEWVPSQYEPMPEKEKGIALIKVRRSAKDKLIEQGRAGNKGCYIASWAFMLTLVAALIFGLKSCIGW